MYKQNCEECGGYYEGRGRFFCCYKCWAIFQTKNKKLGENSYNWKGGLFDIKCLECSNIFKVFYGRKDSAKFCSNQCRGTWLSHNKSGKNHPQWNGGWQNKLPKCEDCHKILSSYKSKKCRKHFALKEKYRANWKDGKLKCLGCNIILTTYNIKRCRKCNSKFRIKENSANWKGGITSLQMQIRNSKKYIELLKEAKARDHYQCLMSNCSFNSNILHSNHIKRFSTILSENNIQTLDDSYNCKELWDEKNLITLCKPCHQSIRGQEEKFKNLFQIILCQLYGYKYKSPETI